MAVTTGKDTTTTSGGGRPSGGPGGPNGPNSGPSRGSGGQNSGRTNSPSNSSSGPAKATASSPASGSKSAPSSSSSKTASSSRNPTGGSLASPARTAPSSGITGRSPAQQKDTDKAKQNATQYGGAQTSMRAATTSRAPTQSAKVTDPSRGGITSPMSGQGTSYKTPEKAASANQGIAARSGLAKDVAKTLSGYGLPSRAVAQDPSIAGRAAQANQNYSVTSGPGGMVSRTYNDPDVAAAQQAEPSFIDRITRGLQGINNSIQSAYGVPEAGPNRGLSNPSVGQQLGAATVDAYDKIKTAAGGFIDNLMDEPMIGAQTTAPGPMTVNGSILGENQTFGPRNMSQVMAGDYPRSPFDAQTPIPTSMRVAAPPPSIVSGSLDQMALENSIQDPTARTLSSLQGRQSFKNAVADATSPKPPPAGKQIADRVPQEPSAPAAPSVADPRLAAMQEQFERMKAARGQRGPTQVAQTSAQPTSPQPEMSPEDILPAEPTIPTRVAGNVLRPGQSPQDLIAAVKRASAMVRGLGDVAPAAPSTPTEIDINGYPQSVSPSQEGSFPPDQNFMQDAGQPDDLGQLGNRYDYEKARAVEGFKALPERLWNAITSGDIRGFTPETNDKRVVIPPTINGMPQSAMIDPDAVAVARLLALLKVLEQQGGNQQQADLVNSTFI